MACCKRKKSAKGQKEPKETEACRALSGKDIEKKVSSSYVTRMVTSTNLNSAIIERLPQKGSAICGQTVSRNCCVNEGPLGL